MFPVQEFGVAEYKGVPVVSSRKVAEVFERHHSDVLKTIRGHLDEIESVEKHSNRIGLTSPILFKESHYKSKGRMHPEYLITKDGFIYTAMGFHGEKAAMFRIWILRQLDDKANAIKNREEARIDFPDLTDAIQEYHPNPQRHDYANECNMLNQIVLGMTAKQFKAVHSIKGNSIRPYLNAEQIHLIGKLQRMDITLIMAGTPFVDRRRVLTEFKERTLDRFRARKSLPKKGGIACSD